MKELTAEERERRADEFIKELDEIGRRIEKHEIATFGRVLTQEEHDQSWAEDKAERMAKYKDMSVEEYLAAKEKERIEIDRELIEMGVDPDLLVWEQDPSDEV